MKTILHATDFSANAIDSLKYAAELSIKTQGRLFVIHVFDTSLLSSDLNETYLLPYTETLQQKNKKLLEFCETHLKSILNKLLITTIAVENSNVVTGIISKATELNASIIVVGMQGKSIIETLILGSTTKQLIKKSPFPILSIPAGCLLNNLETIVYATDFEEEDISAISKLSQLANVFNATIKIVHISPVKNKNGVQEMEWFKEILKQKVDYNNLEFELLFFDDTYNVLKMYIKEVNADLLAMLERNKKDIIKHLFHRDLVERMESESTIPLISFNEIYF
jgi:nucleotide-binding universal stress UspA family protein